jgi:hypothetical protein
MENFIQKKLTCYHSFPRDELFPSGVTQAYLANPFVVDPMQTMTRIDQDPDIRQIRKHHNDSLMIDTKFWRENFGSLKPGCHLFKYACKCSHI